MDAHISLPARFDIAIVEAIDKWCGAEIRWGKDDCLTALAEIVQNVTGHDLAKPYRGRYRSAKGAIRVLGRGGVPGALARGARRLGWGRLAPISCQSGALGMIETGAGLAGVIRYGSHWIGRVDNGFACYPTFTEINGRQLPLVERAWGYE